MPEAEPLVEVHGVRDGVVALQSDDGQREDGQLGGEHAEEAGRLQGRDSTCCIKLFDFQTCPKSQTYCRLALIYNSIVIDLLL